MKTLMILSLLALVTGCLKTRSELKGTQSSSMQTGNNGRYVDGNMGQQQRAQIDSRFFEIDRDFRQLYGKIETIEQQVSEAKSNPAVSGLSAPADQEKIKKMEKRISTLEEALLAIDKKLSQLTNSKDKTSAVTKKPKGPYGYGELYFSKGKYEDAITSYDKYRRKYPRGQHYAQATLKMGLCFQKLKMNQDAKAFYKEVIQRYPKTRVAIKAQKNLKKL